MRIQTSSNIFKCAPRVIRTMPQLAADITRTCLILARDHMALDIHTETLNKVMKISASSPYLLDRCSVYIVLDEPAGMTDAALAELIDYVDLHDKAVGE